MSRLKWKLKCLPKNAQTLRRKGLWDKSLIIQRSHLGVYINVYNGITFKVVKVNAKRIGSKFGEFRKTRRYAKKKKKTKNKKNNTKNTKSQKSVAGKSMGKARK